MNHRMALNVLLITLAFELPTYVYAVHSKERFMEAFKGVEKVEPLYGSILPDTLVSYAELEKELELFTTKVFDELGKIRKDPYRSEMETNLIKRRLGNELKGKGGALQFTLKVFFRSHPEYKKNIYIYIYIYIYIILSRHFIQAWWRKRNRQTLVKVSVNYC